MIYIKPGSEHPAVSLTPCTLLLILKNDYIFSKFSVRRYSYLGVQIVLALLPEGRVDSLLVKAGDIWRGEFLRALLPSGPSPVV